MPGDFSKSHWQNNKVISAINRFVLMRIVLYSSHEFAFEFLCFRDFRMYTMFYFIVLFYHFLNVYFCVICASKTGGMLLFAPWPTTFTRPDITHFEERNSRPDF